MKIHTYEKFWLAASMLLIVGFILTITYGTVGIGIAMVDDSADTVDPDNLGDHPKFSDPGVEQVGENEYDVYVRALQFAFIPGDVEVPANSTVTFHVTSSDVIHSYSVVGTNANTMVIPGEVATITVETEEPGEHGIICTEYCGSGHHNMAGKLIIVPEDEFELEEEQ
ncbi:cupredoxin domain-containing protein [Natronomonas sp. LN261]|jgi:cytochrome c oxidase subunit 2|uniref:cupredoxin domain-containing protein n=1 Tax=Natronomonas sp. LN261 TaxID=2750669 RepID=UPI0015EE9F2C|nr:cupredoxin domain-containing protein [Natronomonas sp. LN261]